MALVKARTLNQKGSLGVAGLNDFLRQFKNLDKEINKAIRRVNIGIAKEVSNDAIKLGKRQTVAGRAVLRRDLAVRGIKARARQNQASIELQGHSNNAILSLELGRLTQFVPRKGKIPQKKIGTYPNSRPGAGRLYRSFVGDKAFKTGFGGYVVGKTIQNALPQIAEQYLDRVFDAIEKQMEMNKVVNIPIRFTTGSTRVIGKIKKVA
jgi:hypothetical protein